MTYRASSFLALVVISNILLVTIAGRNNLGNPITSSQEDKKEPQWLFKHDHGKVHIPGIGQVGIPPKYRVTPHIPYTGGGRGAGTGTRTGTGTEAGSGPSGHSYVPGGDDTFVPNPGFEVPIPGNGGGVPAVVHP